MCIDVAWAGFIWEKEAIKPQPAKHLLGTSDLMQFWQYVASTRPRFARRYDDEQTGPNLAYAFFPSGRIRRHDTICDVFGLAAATNHDVSSHSRLGNDRLPEINPVRMMSPIRQP